MEIDMTGLVLPERIETTRPSADGKSAEFVMEPLERGFGYTLGNAIRRVLLSSLRGSAVWALRSNEVRHEHATIQSVVEDVHQVIHNLKALVITLDEGVEDAVLKIETNEAGAVAAASIRAPASVTIHDPTQHILTLQEARALEIELYVNKGRGFVLADQMPTTDDEPVGLVRIDAIYNPVLRANFTVQETRVGQRTDFDKLTVRVETDGSVRPDEAIRSAAALVQRYVGFMLDFGSNVPALPTTPPALVSADVAKLLESPIDEIDKIKPPHKIDTRHQNLLKTQAIEKLRDLVGLSRDDLLGIEGFGEKSVDKLVDVLEKMDLRLGMKIEEDEKGGLLVFEEPATQDE